MCFLFYCIAVRTHTPPAKKKEDAALTHTHPPCVGTGRELVRVKCILIIPKTAVLSGRRWRLYWRDVHFEFFRLRFHFRAVDPLAFPPAETANLVRGALG